MNYSCWKCGTIYLSHIERDFCSVCFERTWEKELKMSINDQIKEFKEWMNKNPNKVQMMRLSVVRSELTNSKIRSCSEPLCQCKMHESRYRGILGHS